jgi:hypothetical protein
LTENQLIIKDYERIEEDLNKIKEGVEGALPRLMENAEYYAEMFREGRSMAYKEGDKEDFSTLGVRVRLRGELISAEWYRNYNFYSDATKPTGVKRKPYSKYIKKNTRTGYSKTIFNSEPDWAKEMAVITEDRFKDIRRINSMLSDMTRNINTINTILDRMENKDRKLLGMKAKSE